MKKNLSIILTGLLSQGVSASDHNRNVCEILDQISDNTTKQADNLKNNHFFNHPAYGKNVVKSTFYKTRPGNDHISSSHGISGGYFKCAHPDSNDSTLSLQSNQKISTIHMKGPRTVSDEIQVDTLHTKSPHYKYA